MPQTLPIVDVAPVFDGGEAGLRAVASAVGQACRTVGFFYVVNAPIAADLRPRLFAAAKTFFAADPAVKEAVSIRHSPHNRGYVGLGVEALDPKTAPDRKEAFNVGLELEPDDPEVLAEKPFRGVNLWPALPGFRDTCLATYDAFWALGRALHRAVALDLGLHPDFFEPHLDRPLAILRLLHYPATVRDGALGAGTHTDYGNLTLLATDAVGGLQVRTRGGAWIDAPPLPDAFVCNIGDLLMRWSDDVYVSTPHRVVSPSGRERTSVAFFLDPNPDTVVGHLPLRGGADGPGRYPPITAADYLRQRLDATYAPPSNPMTA